MEEEQTRLTKYDHGWAKVFQKMLNACSLKEHAFKLKLKHVL
jgi:hypothetical protein